MLLSYVPIQLKPFLNTHSLYLSFRISHRQNFRRDRRVSGPRAITCRFPSNCDAETGFRKSAKNDGGQPLSKSIKMELICVYIPTLVYCLSAWFASGVNEDKKMYISVRYSLCRMPLLEFNTFR